MSIRLVPWGARLPRESFPDGQSFPAVGSQQVNFSRQAVGIRRRQSRSACAHQDLLRGEDRGKEVGAAGLVDVVEPVLDRPSVEIGAAAELDDLDGEPEVEQCPVAGVDAAEIDGLEVGIRRDRLSPPSRT